MSPLSGEEKDYIRLKIALSRLIPPWKSALLDQNCSVLNLNMYSEPDLNIAKGALKRIISERKGLLHGIWASCFSVRKTPNDNLLEFNDD